MTYSLATPKVKSFLGFTDEMAEVQEQRCSN